MSEGLFGDTRRGNRFPHRANPYIVEMRGGQGARATSGAMRFRHGGTHPSARIARDQMNYISVDLGVRTLPLDNVDPSKAAYNVRDHATNWYRVAHHSVEDGHGVLPDWPYQDIDTVSDSVK
jgi:hypothetical protein